jgi:hypothetical protein
MADEMYDGGPEIQYKLPIFHWTKCRTVIPRNIGGKWFWPGQTVYRIWVRGTDMVYDGYYRYGTIFDVLKEA